MSFNMSISDEVESLAAARKAALSGSEPSDSIRVLYFYSSNKVFYKLCEWLLMQFENPISGCECIIDSDG